MTIRKVQKGERLAIRASDWNEIASHVNGGQGTPSVHQGENRRFVYVLNKDEERPMLRGMTIKIAGTRPQPGKKEGELPDDYIFNAEFPNSGETFIPAVMETDAEAAGGVGRAVISGIAAARISGGSGIFGTPDGEGSLILSGSGAITAIPFDGSDEWRYVILGGGAFGATTGMFTILLIQDEDSMYATVLDTTLPREVAEASDAGAGIAHVNNQPYKIKPTTLNLPNAGNTKYIYLHLNASKNSGDAAKQSNVELDGSGTVGIKVTLKIEASNELQRSTFADTYYLIGRVTACSDGDSVTYTISQDHHPGNLYMLWYGDGVGIGEEAVNE